MRPGQVISLTFTAGLLVWLFWPRPTTEQLTPLEQKLEFRGAVRQMIQTDRHEDEAYTLGKQEDHTVTEISRDGQKATRKWNQKYTLRTGEVSYSGSLTFYEVIGRKGQEKVIERTQYLRDGKEGDTTFTLTTYENGCPVKSFTESSGRFGNHTSINEQTCDKRGRTLTDTFQSGDQLRTRSTSTNWWLPAGIGIGKVWNAGFENRPATTNWGLQFQDKQGQTRIFSLLANVTTKQSVDSRGNWVWRKDSFKPTPMSGNNVATREITYWDK